MAVHLAVTGTVFDGVFLYCPFFQRDVLDEIWDLTESVSEGFPTYSFSRKLTWMIGHYGKILCKTYKNAGGGLKRNIV